MSSGPDRNSWSPGLVSILLTFIHCCGPYSHLHTTVFFTRLLTLASNISLRFLRKTQVFRKELAVNQPRKTLLYTSYSEDAALLGSGYNITGFVHIYRVIDWISESLKEVTIIWNIGTQLSDKSRDCSPVCNLHLCCKPQVGRIKSVSQYILALPP